MILGPAFFGWALLVVAALVLVWQAGRVAKANPAARLPYFGSPAVQPAHSRLVVGLVVALIVFGLWLLDDGHPAHFWVGLAALLVLIAGSVAHTSRHNRRVSL